MTVSVDITSASQVALFRECQRKYAFRYIARIESPPSPAAALGIEVDDNQLQPYFKSGRPFDYTQESGSGYIAASGLAYLPSPTVKGLEVQKHFVMPSPSWREHRFGYQGYIDLWVPDSSALPDIAPAGIPAVVDFKTTSNLKWAKTPEALSTDVQAQLYATHAMYETGARAVDLVWIYFQTKGPRKAIRSHLRVVADRVAEQFAAIDETAKQMVQIRREVTDPLTLPPNAAMCEAYGGCPYRDKCNLSPHQIIESFAAKAALGSNAMPNAMDLLANLKAKKNGAPAAAPPARPTHFGSPQTAPAPTEIPAAFLPPATAAPAPLGINPPEAGLPAAPPQEKPKRGRPPKAAAAAPAATPAPAPAQPAEVVSSKPIATLYLDCYPVGEDVSVAEAFFAAAQVTIQETHGVPDYRLIDFKGAGVFATALGALLDAEAVGDVVLDTRTPEGMIAKSVFVQRAERVVQGRP